MHNPLLEQGELPDFTTIRPEHIEPAIDQLLADNRAALDQLLLDAEGDDLWTRIIAPLEAMNDHLQRVWSPVRHLNAVANTPELREVFNPCREKISLYWSELGQHAGLFAVYRAIADGPEYAALDAARQRAIDNALRDFRLSGIDLPEAEQKQFLDNEQALSRLTSRFSDNLLDATQGWHILVSDEAELAGIPAASRTLFAEAAGREGQQGWRIGLEFPSYFAVMAHADNRALRETLYHAFTTRASDQGPNAGQWDNSAVMAEILALRHAQAELLGYANFAELSLATKMATEPQQVLDFLTDLAARSLELAQGELDELSRFARDELGLDTLEAWDVTYAGEKLREARYAISQEELRPWFPAERVVRGMFAVVERLYGLAIVEQPGASVWHPDVHFYEVRDADGKLRGRFYLDLYARNGKRGGAWMDDCVVRRRDGEHLQTPVAFLTCNFTPAPLGQPALLTHDEVQTLFHEFGHGLHHLLTRVEVADVSGINGVPWDAVELPSQFMENWCWEREALNLISGHVESGEPLPDSEFGKLLAARNFQAGMQMVRQLEFALFDFRLHLEYDPEKGARVQELLDTVRTEVAVVRPPAYNRFQHGFSHIFAGGYAAGYYSYKWAEVLSADAFSRFEEEGIFNRATGSAFLENILEQGGSADPMQLFVAFRGREPSIDALLRHTGIVSIGA